MLTDMNYVGSFSVRNTDKWSIPPRLRVRMNVMLVSVSQKDVENCFCSLLKQTTSPVKNVKQLTEFVIKMFSQTIQGLNKESFLRLLKHECEREFLDVLFDESSYQTARSIVQQNLFKSIDVKLSQKVSNSRVLYCDGGFLQDKSDATNSNYTKFTAEELFHCAKEHLDSFVLHQTEYEGFVLFEACIENLVKVLRFLTRAKQSICFLVGSKAAGREFVCRLACFMKDIHLQKIDGFFERPSSIIQRRIAHNSASKQCIIVRNAARIDNLEWHNLNQLVSESDIMYLNQAENAQNSYRIVEDVKSVALNKEDMKIIFFMDASFARIKELIHMFPQLQAMQYMRFENIPPEAHFEIGTNSLSRCFTNLGSAHKYARITHNIHSHAIQISNEFKLTSGYHFNFDVRYFKTFLSKFVASYREKIDQLEKKNRLVTNAIVKLELYQRNLEQMENTSRQEDAALKDLRTRISETFKEVTSEKSSLERQKRKVSCLQYGCF
eukprot:758011-Hanusia_phi.AAC.2